MLTRFTKSATLVLVWALAGCTVVPADAPEPSPQPALAEPSTSVPVIPPLKASTREDYGRAVDLLRNGDHDQAFAMFTQLSRSQPELAGPWVNLGVIHLAAERPDQARLAHQQALAANPENCDALNQLGVMARREGRFEDAEAFYLRCLNAQPMYAHARLNLAILYELYLGRLGDALAAYQDYEQTLDEPDTRVRGWVMDLERRVAAIAKR